MGNINLKSRRIGLGNQYKMCKVETFILSILKNKTKDITSKQTKTTYKQLYVISKPPKSSTHMHTHIYNV